MAGVILVALELARLGGRSSSFRFPSPPGSPPASCWSSSPGKSGIGSASRWARRCRPGVPRETLREVVQPASTIALLGAIESLLSAVVADGMIGGRHRSNMELVAQGVANIASSLFSGIAATGGIARTATNVRNGGRTPVAGIVHALALLVTTLFVGRYAIVGPFLFGAAEKFKGDAHAGRGKPTRGHSAHAERERDRFHRTPRAAGGRQAVPRRRHRGTAGGGARPTCLVRTAWSARSTRRWDGPAG